MSTLRLVRSRSFGVIAYVVAVAVLYSAAVVAVIARPGPLSPPVEFDWVLLTVFVSLIVALQKTKVDLFGGSTQTLTFVPIFAMSLLMAPGVGSLVASMTLLCAQVGEDRPWYKQLFNATVIPGASIAGSLMFYALVGGPNADHIIRHVPALLIASQCAFAVNTAAVALAFAFSEGRHPYAVWREKFRWLAPHYAALGLASYAGSVLYLLIGLVGVALFAMPVAMLWVGLTQYTTRSRAGVERLEQAHDAIAKSEKRFRSLVQNAPGFVAVLNEDATIQYLTPGSVGGGARERGRPRSFLSLVRPHDLPSLTSALAEVRARSDLEVTLALRLRHPDGSSRDYSAIAKNLLNDPSVGGIVINAHDVTERKALEDLLRHQAFHDVLTQLPNRALFLDRVGQALAGSSRRGRRVGIMFIDLDRFKVINDSLGHPAGDELLIAVSRRIISVVRGGDTVARFGGDEFVVLLEDLESEAEAERAASRLMGALGEPVHIQGHTAVVTASIGIALGDAASDARELVRRADVAVFRAKSEGRARYVLYDEAVDSLSGRRFELESDLRQAVELGQLRLHYQPELDLRSGRVVGFEALVRWQHPTRGLVPPQDFISMAEETGEIIPIGQWVLREACRQASEWQTTIPGLAPFTVAVNLSARELLESNVVDHVERSLREAGLKPAALRLEITESVLMQDTPNASRVLAELKALGVELAIDDFGTGYSSLNYLRRLPADVLKVDRAFVTNVDYDQREASIVQAVVHVAEALQMRVVAEGIERLGQARVLSRIGCATGQGYLFCRPQPADEAAVYVLGRLSAERLSA